MLKKLISLFALLLLTGCSKSTIAENLYVNSIGFDYKDEYIVHLYASSSFDHVINEKKQENVSPQIGYAKGKNLVECITKLETSIYETINYEHIRTGLFTKDFLDKERLEEVILYLGNKHRLSIDFCIFITNDIEAIYNIKSLDDVSSNNALFLNPTLNTTLYGNLSYTQFVSSFYEEYRGAKIPHLVIKEDLWNYGENNKSITIEGFYYYNDDYYEYLFDENLEYTYDFKNKKIDIDGLIVKLSNYSISLDIVEKGLEIEVSTNIVTVVNKEDFSDLEVNEIVKGEIEEKIKAIIEINKKVDILNARDFLYRRGKQFNEIEYKISVDIRK